MNSDLCSYMDCPGVVAGCVSKVQLRIASSGTCENDMSASFHFELLHNQVCIFDQDVRTAAVLATIARESSAIRLPVLIVHDQRPLGGVCRYRANIDGARCTRFRVTATTERLQGASEGILVGSVDGNTPPGSSASKFLQHKTNMYRFMTQECPCRIIV